MKWLRNYLFLRRHYRACVRLQRMVDERRNSFEVIDFSKRRKAALKRREV